jgi:hypothetical protein
MTERIDRPRLRSWVIATLVPLVLALLTNPSVTGGSRQNSTDWFPAAVPGGSLNGQIYLELPLQSAYYGAGSTREQRWKAFFKRALKDEVDYVKGPAYWAPRVADRSTNLDFIAEAAGYKIGEVVWIRTPNETFKAHLSAYEIHCDDINGGCLLVGVCLSDSTSKLPDYPLVLGNRREFGCRAACSSSAKIATPDIANRIVETATTRLGIRPDRTLPAALQQPRVVAYSGHFTDRRHVQYIAYVAYYAKEDPSDANWATFVFDPQDGSVVVLGRNQPSQIIPDRVGDVDGDGLDEIWARISTAEGGSAAVFYKSGSANSPVFSNISTLYWGL